jgi:hypothetical protein
MLGTIYEKILNFFNTKNTEKDDKKIGIDKNVWVENELQKWKLDLYSKNTYLNVIPATRIIQKKIELKNKYDSLFSQK